MKLHTWIFKLLQVSLVIGMMFLSGWSNAEDQSALPNKIENVDFSSLPGGRVVIRIKTTESLANAPAGFTLSNPARIALDFPNVGNGLAKNNILANQGALKSVTLAQAKERTRLVLNLSKNVGYSTAIEGLSLIHI